MWADNKLTVTSASGHPDEEVQVSVTLANSDAPTGVELRFELPDALKYVEGSAVLQTERSKDHQLTAAMKDGRLHIVVFSPLLASLQGNSGELCSFRLKLKKEPADYVLNPVVVLSDARGNKLDATVESGVVTLLSPKIEIVTPTVDFGHIPIRSTYTNAISVRNVGTESLEISAVTSDRADLVAPQQSYSIAPGTTQQVQLMYSPMKHGAITSKVSFTTNAVNPKAGVANVVADPFSVNELHVQHVEGVSDEEVTVVLKMNNMEPISGAQINLQLPQQLVYVEGSAMPGIVCGSTDHRVTASYQNGLLVLALYSTSNQVIPEGNGDLMTFRVRLNGASGWYHVKPAKVVLSNVGMENMVSAVNGEYVVIKSPTFRGADELNMGREAVTNKQTATYTISNNGSVDLVINKVTFLADNYAVEEPLPLVVAPYQSKTITVSYTPTQEGAHKTTMQIYTNDPNDRMHSVAVSGEIYEPNVITVTGENIKGGYSFDFGLNNYTEIVAVQLQISWLPGMKTTMENLLASDRIKNHSYFLSEVTPGVYQVIIYSMNNTPILGNEGNLFTLNYTPVAGTAYRDTELKVTKVVLSDVKGKNYTSEKEVSALAKFTFFTLYFKVDGEIVSEQWVKAGEKFSVPDVAEKTGYSFAWNGLPETMPTEDVVVEGGFTVNKYQLTYTVDDEVFHTDSVEYGKVLSETEAPTKEGHTFSGWSGIPETMPAKDVVVKGSFSINSYALTYKVDGEVVQSDSVAYGSALTALAEPTKEGHTFSGWSEVPATMPAKDVVVEGNFVINSYTLTYKVDGEVVQSDSVVYGSALTALDEPTKEGYTFSGWSEVPATMPAKDVVVEGNFAINSYSLTYKVDGKVVQSDSVVYGSALTALAEPTKEGYTFSGWSEVPATMPAKDVVVEGNFVINSYTLTYKVDGEVVQSDSVVYGSALTALDEPTKEGHTFSGWSEVPATMPAKDVIVEGNFIVNSYMLTYKVDGEIIETSTVAYGTTITSKVEPTKEGYTFSGWSEVPATMPAKDVVVEGNFTINSYTLTYKVDGEVVETSSVEYGSALTALAEPTKEGHTFSGWSEVPATMPAKDVIVEGSFTVNS